MPYTPILTGPIFAPSQAGSKKASSKKTTSESSKKQSAAEISAANLKKAKSGKGGSGTSDYLKNNPIPLGSSATKTLIGVDETQLSYVPKNNPANPTGKQYYLGYELKPVNYTPEHRAQIQDQMRRAGLFGSKWSDVRVGQWDDISQQAYFSALSYANQNGTTVTDMLNRMIQTGPSAAELAEIEGGGRGGGGAKVPKLTMKVSNPADLHALVEETSKSLYGYKADPETISRIVAGFQNEEKRAQQQMWNADATGNGGVVTDAPNAEQFAKDQLRAENPVAAEGHDVAGVFNTFANIISRAGMQ